MRRVFIFMISLLCLATRPGDAKSGQRMLDPLFGIAYDPERVHFEVVPASVSQACPKYRSRKLWIYAHLRAADTEYFVVSGFMKFYPDGPGPASTAPDPGIAIALHGEECLHDPSEWVMAGEANPSNKKPILVNEAILNGLAADAIERYTKAFGGKKNFLAALKSRPSPGEIAPVMQRHVDEFISQESTSATH